MSTVIIVDSACDLPESLLKSKSIQVLPLNVRIAGNESIDSFTPEDRLRLIKDGTISIKNDDHTAPTSREQMIDFLTQTILPNFDFAMAQTVAKARSPQFQMWHELNMSFQSQYRNYRKTDQAFTLRTADSGTMFTGQGLMALNTIHLAQQKIPRRGLLEQSREFSQYIQSYSAPVDLKYIRERGKQKGERSVSAMSAVLGNALNITPIIYGGQNKTETVAKEKGHVKAVNRIIDHAIMSIDKGLKSPHISIAYAGPLNELNQFDRYRELQDVAKENNVKISTSVATLSTIINVGPGNFSLAVAPNDIDFRITTKH